MTNIFLSLSWPQSACATQQPIVPVFIPYAGCPVRCVFCAQHIQTGQEPAPLALTLKTALNCLQQRAARGLPPAELAFYGGTFTAQPPEALRACLHFFNSACRQGLVTGFRCSTRPDALDIRRLAMLRDAGCTMVELGIQSFNDAALQAAARGYSGQTARAACHEVTASGMRLGVQLMPGMPGVTPEIFLQDVALLCTPSATITAHAARFYPCVVMKGTTLERLWREGCFTPWPLEQTLDVLAAAWLMTQQAHLPVIRMGLAAEASLAPALLAGPWDPALGSRIMARALFFRVRRALAELGMPQLLRLEVPRRCQGFFWGARNELRPHWESLGLSSPPRWIAENLLRIEAAAPGIPFPSAPEGEQQT